ncbi:MAG: hypothetical protein ACJ780_23270 [Solirubrobacteraceae bacterium]
MPLRARTFAHRRTWIAVILPMAAVLAMILAARAGAASTSRPTASNAKATAYAAVPQGFVGVDVDGPVFGPDTTLDFGRQLKTMVSNGVQSIRTAFSWAAAQPYKANADVPADQKGQFTDIGGVPTNFQATDMIVGNAARNRLKVLPTVLYTPSWDAIPNRHGIATPRRSAPYAAYLTALIGRYGPHGSFWRANPRIPRMPIRSWQIWNEPNLVYYWKQPFAASYVPFLRNARRAIKKADPGAQVVLGALTNTAWKSLGQIYKIRGARGLFDVMAVNGFTKTPANVMLFMVFVRRVMARFGDGVKPLVATEVSWPSAKGHTHDTFDFVTTRAGQAHDIATLLPLIGQQRLALHLIGFYWYTWMGEETPTATAFNFSGLLAFREGKVTIKPALGAFRAGALSLEGCKRKGLVATSCIR